uniref:Uncharacterized protein n=1 Tax=Anopheles christyi TaxID=43041 RepID=A0A182KBY1_9DIPT
MIQMHPSTILTSTEAQGILNASTMCTANTVTISGANNVGSSTTAQNATMRVLKTATGTTTVIKTEVTASAAPVQQLSQGIRHQLLDKHRKESSAQVGSKVIVTPNISTGQLIPLESLLQKQGVTATANNSPGGVNTFLKITGTNKTGQQFLQFTTSSNAATSGSSTSASNVSSNSGTPIGSVGHQYTIVPQARNIISVASAAGTGRQTKLPLTIVSSSEQNDTFQSAASIIVANKKANVSEVNATGDSGTSLVTQMTNSPVGKQVPQGTKVKLLATTQSPKSFSSGPIASSTTIQPQNTVFNTKTSPAPTDLLNAKIIGVRNIASTKLKGTSSLSLMNAGGLNIAHIGGKPVIIANNSAIGTNHLHNNSVNKGTPAGTMLLTANTNSNNLVLGQQNSNAASLSGLPSTARRESACTNIANGIPGQIQTVMIRNNLLKVQSVPSTTANKLSHHKTIAAGSGGNSGTTSGINTSTSTIIASAGRSTQLHQQPHDAQVQYSQQNTQKHQQIISSGGTAVILTPNIPTSNAQLNTTGADEKPFVRLHSSDIANNSDGGPQRTQSQRIVLSQPIMIPADVNKSGNAFNFKRVKVIPISKQPKK